jgi:two-component system, NarL family, response regulator NreC
LLTLAAVARHLATMATSAAEITLFIADDHKIVRDGLQVLIARQPGMRMIGEAGDGRALVAGVLAGRPDVVLTDMSMPELNGLDAIRQLRDGGYEGAIVVLSQRDERRFVAEAIDAGANAYVLKDHAFEQVVAAIHAARAGERWLSPQLQAMVEGGSVPLLAELLSPREREVLQLFAEGHGTKEVAFRLQVSPKTIETHRLNLLAKLKAGGVVDLVRIAVKEGLVEL